MCSGNKLHEKKGDDESDDELLHLEDSDTEVPCDDDIEPVLQVMAFPSPGDLAFSLLICYGQAIHCFIFFTLYLIMQHIYRSF